MQNTTEREEKKKKRKEKGEKKNGRGGEKKEKEKKERVAIHWGPNYIRIGVFWKDGFLEIDAFAGQFHDQSHVFIHVASPSPIRDVCSVLLSNKDQEDQWGGTFSNGSLEFETMKASAKRAVWRAARPPKRALWLYSTSLFSFSSSSSSHPSLNSFLPPPPSPSALFVSPQRVCSSPRSAVFPWAFFVSSGPRAGGESISEDGRGIKEPLLRASRLWQSALAPAEKYVTRENQFQRWLPRRPRP